jgi:hypothetical protein
MKVKEFYYDMQEEKEACKKKQRHRVEDVDKYVYAGVEFPTESEMQEYIFESLGGLSDIQVSTDTLQKALDYSGVNFKNYVVCAVDVPNKIYLTRNSKCRYSYRQSDAKRYTLNEAKRAAVFATLNGTHYWKAIRIDSFEFTRKIN